MQNTKQALINKEMDGISCIPSDHKGSGSHGKINSKKSWNSNNILLLDKRVTKDIRRQNKFKNSRDRMKNANKYTYTYDTRKAVLGANFIASNA